MVGVRVWSCWESKFLHQISTRQVVATTSINDDTSTLVLDDEEGLEQVVVLTLIGMLHLRAKNILYNYGHVAQNTPTAKDKVILARRHQQHQCHHRRPHQRCSCSHHLWLHTSAYLDNLSAHVHVPSSGGTECPMCIPWKRRKKHD